MMTLAQARNYEQQYNAEVAQQRAASAYPLTGEQLRKLRQQYRMNEVDAALAVHSQREDGA